MSELIDEEFPTFFKKSTKNKKATKLREPLVSDDTTEGSQGHETVFRPKKTVLANRLKSSIGERARTSPQTGSSLYSKEYLSSLREATPATPKEYASNPLDATEQETENVEEETSTGEAQNATILVPDNSTIRHLKQQREIRREAGENYIPLSDALTFSKGHIGDTRSRLQTEDDVDNLGGDGNEGLAGYESDSLPLGGRNTEKAKKERIALMETMINGIDADDYPVEDELGRIHDKIDDEPSSDSDDEWERTQTLKSAGTTQKNKTATGSRASVPDMKPIPSIGQVLQRLRMRLESAKSESELKAKVIQDIEQQQAEIADREEAIKMQLQRANLTYATAQMKLGGIESISQS